MGPQREHASRRRDRFRLRWAHGDASLWFEHQQRFTPVFGCFGQICLASPVENACDQRVEFVVALERVDGDMHDSSV